MIFKTAARRKYLEPLRFPEFWFVTTHMPGPHEVAEKQFAFGQPMIYFRLNDLEHQVEEAHIRDSTFW